MTEHDRILTSRPDVKTPLLCPARDQKLYLSLISGLSGSGTSVMLDLGPGIMIWDPGSGPLASPRPGIMIWDPDNLVYDLQARLRHGAGRDAWTALFWLLWAHETPELRPKLTIRLN